jgi:hypothetical protein
MRHRGDGVLSPSRIGINIRTYITAFFEFVGAAHGPPKTHASFAQHDNKRRPPRLRVVGG